MATLFAGTSGFAYPAWKPAFYPAKLPAKEFLAFYSGRLNCVEINYTFRRLPAASTLEAWVAATRPGFVFAVKAHMRITHMLRLKNAEQATDVFLKAIDPLRTARRLGAKSATLVYRRSEQEMPARLEEVHHAKQEGVQFRMLTNPEELLGDEKGWLTGARCVRMELGEPDASGRRSPVEIKGSDFILPANLIIIGVGTTANPLIQSTTPDLKVTKRNYIVIDEESTRTSKRGVFAGGDIVTGGATVILAMGAGRKAAASIHEYLTTGVWEVPAKTVQ